MMKNIIYRSNEYGKHSDGSKTYPSASQLLFHGALLGKYGHAQSNARAGAIWGRGNRLAFESIRKRWARRITYEHDAISCTRPSCRQPDLPGHSSVRRDDHIHDGTVYAKGRTVMKTRRASRNYRYRNAGSTKWGPKIMAWNEHARHRRGCRS